MQLCSYLKRLPVLVRLKRSVSSELAECYIRPIPHIELRLENGTLLQEFTVMEGTLILVSCEEGYEHSSNNTNLTCLASGKMSDKMPLCTKAPGKPRQNLILFFFL